MSTKINLIADDYYTQRNNSIRPLGACIPTSRVMFYKGNKMPFVNTSKLADDDFLMSLLNSSEAKDYCYRNYPWAYDNEHPEKSLPPNEVNGMYPEWLDKKLFGKKLTRFVTNLTFENYLEILEKGQVLMTSIALPGLRIFGHGICVIGYQEESLLLADPFGNLNKGYKDTKGYMVPISRQQFIDIVKPLGEEKKWGHITI